MMSELRFLVPGPRGSFQIHSIHITPGHTHHELLEEIRRLSFPGGLIRRVIQRILRTFLMQKISIANVDLSLVSRRLAFQNISPYRFY